MPQTLATAQALCPCCSGKNFAECCAAIVQGEKKAGSAEALMRSRYTAFTMNLADYLFATMAPEKQAQESIESFRASLDQQNQNTQWTGLEILATRKGKSKDTQGKVEFKAHFLQDGTAYVMHEVSRFRKAKGQWFYVDGQYNMEQEA